MNRISLGVLIGVLTCAAIPGAAWSAVSTAVDPDRGPTIHTEDVDRFYEIYDIAGGHPTADQLQHDYLDPGSDGLHQFVGYRVVKSYYQHATDKRRALREILEMTDPHAFLARSGWHPGIQLQ